MQGACQHASRSESANSMVCGGFFRAPVVVINRRPHRNKTTLRTIYSPR
jgi:hypothetical protein